MTHKMIDEFYACPICPDRVWQAFRESGETRGKTCWCCEAVGKPVTKEEYDAIKSGKPGGEKTQKV